MDGRHSGWPGSADRGRIRGQIHAAELDQEVTGQVVRLDLASFFPPEPEQGRLVIAHDDASVGAAYERATICDHYLISKLKL